MKSVKVHRVITIFGTAEEIIADLLERLNGEDPETIFKADIRPAPVENAMPEGFHAYPLEVPGCKTYPQYLVRTWGTGG